MTAARPPAIATITFSGQANPYILPKILNEYADERSRQLKQLLLGLKRLDCHDRLLSEQTTHLRWSQERNMATRTRFITSGPRSRAARFDRRPSVQVLFGEKRIREALAAP